MPSRPPPGAHAGSLARRPRFAGYAPEKPLLLAVVERVIAAVVVLQLAASLLAAHRAYVQVRRVDLDVAGPVLRAGSVVRADLVSSGRVPVHLRVELVQGGHRETLAQRLVATGSESFYDPRTRSGSVTVTIDPAVLARFEPGPAVVRATGVGRPQWLRLPPPTVREVAVAIAPPAPAGR